MTGLPSVSAQDPNFSEFFSQLALRLSYLDKGQKSKAVGRDGIRREKFQLQIADEIQIISRKCLAGTYRFTRYKERLIPKGPRRLPRQISIPTIRDRLALRALNDYLVSQVPDAKGELPHKYIREINASVKSNGPHHSFVRMDVQEFFPTIDHEILLSELKNCAIDPLAIVMIMQAIKNPTGDGNQENKVGIPQGLSISNILSSIYLRNLDSDLRKHYSYWRYVDDIIITIRSDLATKAFKKIFLDLEKLKLKPHNLIEGSLKSDIVLISAGTEYLGYHISSNKLKVRKSSYNKMFENLMKVFTSYKYSKKYDKFLFRLNLKISGCIFDRKRKGWLFFFPQTEDMKQLRQLDEFVLQCCKKYAPGLDVSTVKKFTRTIFEIRYDLAGSSYFPRFDDFDNLQKIAFISLMTGRNEADIAVMNIEDIDDLFRRAVQREVDVLEEDVQDSLS